MALQQHHLHPNETVGTLGVREEFAARFMAAMMTEYVRQHGTTPAEDQFTLEDAASVSLSAADALIRAINRSNEP